MIRKSQEELTEEIRTIAFSGYFPLEKISAGAYAGNMKVDIIRPFGLSNLIAQVKTTLKNSWTETVETVGYLS